MAVFRSRDNTKGSRRFSFGANERKVTMGAVVVVLIQVVLAVLVAGLVLPAILFTVPPTQTRGPLVLAVVVGAVFVLLRVVWPRKQS